MGRKAVDPVDAGIVRILVLNAHLFARFANSQAPAFHLECRDSTHTHTFIEQQHQHQKTTPKDE